MAGILSQGCIAIDVTAGFICLDRDFVSAGTSGAGVEDFGALVVGIHSHHGDVVRIVLRVSTVQVDFDFLVGIVLMPVTNIISV